MFTLPQDLDRDKPARRAAERRRRVVEHLTPRPVIALDAHSLARAIDPSGRSRGLLLATTADLGAVLDAWTFTYLPGDRLGGSLFLAATVGGWVSPLSVVGTRGEETISWDFECGACMFTRHDRHPVLLRCLDAAAGDFMCAMQLRPEHLVVLVPVRWLAFVEPAEHGEQ